MKYGMKHGLARKPDENEILASSEALWDQIETEGLCKEGVYYQRQAKNCIRAMAFNLIYMEKTQIYRDKKKMHIIWKLKEELVLLNPDKGSCVVIMDIKRLIIYLQIDQSSRLSNKTQRTLE